MKRLQCYAMLVVFLFACPMLAQVPLGRWDKVEKLQPGAAIVIRLKAGDRIECSFREIGAEEIRVSEVNGQTRTFPRSTVQKIETVAKARDRLRNGALIGLAGGAAAGALAATIMIRTHPEWNDRAWSGEDAPGPYFTLIGAGLGALTGTVIDAVIKGPEVLYQSK